MNICVVGYSQHGKDTIGEFIEKHSDLKCTASSEKALELFLFDILSKKHGYKTIKEAYENRHKNRKEWYEAIQQYNTPDKARLAREIMEDGDVYLGLRDAEELSACVEQNIFDVILAVFDHRKPIEDHSSVLDPILVADYVIYNDSSLEALEIATIDFLKSIHQLKK